MFEAYKIGVRIGVVDATGGGILKIAAQFAKAQKEAQGFLVTLRKVNEELRRSSGGWANNTASGYNRASRAANDYASAASRASRAWGGAGIGFAGGAMAARLGGGGGGYSNVPRLGGPSGYSGGAMAAGRSFGGMGGFGGGRGRGGGGASGGGWGQLIGGAMLEQGGKAELGMLSGPIDEAAKYQTAVAKFALFGMGDKLNADAVKFASGMHIIGTSMTDAMNDVTEAQGVFRESGLKGPQALAGAKLAAPFLAKIAYATSGLDSESQARMHTQGLDMLRFIEQRGGLSSASAFNTIANDGWKAIRSSGGNVNWSQYRQFMSTGGVAAQGLTDKALFGEMEPIIGELKGGGAGHALMTSFNRVNGLQRLMPRIMTREMMRLGLWDKSKVVMNSQGGVKDFIGNPLQNANLFSSSPVEYYEKVVKPAYAKAGITSLNDINRENAILFGNTGGKLFSLVNRQLPLIHASVDAQQKAKGINGSVKEVSATFEGQMLDYHKNMANLQIQLGTVILPMLIRGLKWLNPLLQGAAKWIGENSTLTKGLIIVFAALGGLAMVSGSIVAIAGAFTIMSGIAAGGALLSGLTGMVGAFGGLTIAVGLFMSAYAGWKAGGLIYDHALANNAAGRGLGAGIGHVAAFFGSKAAQDAVNGPINNHSGDFHGLPGNKGSVTHVTHVHLDGKVIATTVTKHQAKAASRAQSGSVRFDSTQMPAPVGLGHY